MRPRSPPLRRTAPLASPLPAQAFFRKYGGDDLASRFLTGDDAAAPAAGGAAGETDAKAPAAPAGTESALLRAQMLALGLSRSSTKSGSSRRLRLLQELERSVKELEGEGFRDAEALRGLKDQIRASYATAPDEFIAQARKADLFNEYTPPMSVAEIAAEFSSLAVERVEKVGDGLTQALENADWESLDPGRKRGPREKGNKIEINKPEKD